MLLRSAALVVVAFASAGSASSTLQQRQLLTSQEDIAGYSPRTQVTDHNAIDLDQQAIEERVSLGDIENAWRVYSEGGHSKSYAELTLMNPASNKSYKKGTQVLGLTELGGTASGTLLEDVSWGDMPEDGSGEVVVKVQYTTSDVQSKYVDCQVGALYRFNEANRNGCFVDDGSVSFVPLGSAGAVDKYTYSYDVRQDNKNDRTIQGFSTEADEKMRPAPGADYFDDFQTFVDYYGDTDYANKWILAAYGGNSTNYSSGRGNADFAPMVSTAGKGRAEAFKKGTLFLNIWMYVVRELEDAIADCRVACDLSSPQDCNEDPVYALDEAVAFYTGSLEGEEGTGDGTLLYYLADLRAGEFRTAGYVSNDPAGKSYVNHEIFYWFGEMQEALLSKNSDGTGQCNAAEEIKDTIVNLMKVPLIQNVIRYAYMRGMQENVHEEKSEAEGATSVAALLPYLHACHASSANTIYNELKVGSNAADVNFLRVKETLESVYECLGVSCVMVGGLWDGASYMEDAAPCNDGFGVIDRSPGGPTSPQSSGGTLTGGVNYQDNDSDSSVGPVIVATIAVVVVGVLVGLFLFTRFRSREKKNIAGPVADSNIAAVSAVSDTDLT